MKKMQRAWSKESLIYEELIKQSGLDIEHFVKVEDVLKNA
jgi:hypothetical protein